MHLSGESRHISRSISHLRVAKQLYVLRVPEIKKRIGPAFLSVAHAVDRFVEEEYFFIAVIPSGIGRQHVVIMPGIGGIAESRLVRRSIVFHSRGFHKYGIGEHIHVVYKRKQLSLRVIRTALALYDLTFLILHGTAVEEDGDTVPRVVIQVLGSKYIMVLVLKLHQ